MANEQSSRTTPASAMPEHYLWMNMRARCRNKTDPAWKNYGGRGIAVCARWQGPNGFANFLADMGPRPAGMTIDRRDNDGDYTPSNCRWTTRTIQNRNRRTTVKVEINGVVKSLGEWAEHYGIPYKIAWKRVHKLGWSPKDALTMPLDRQHKNVSQQRLLTHDGVTKSVTEWAVHCGLSRFTLFARLNKGWTAEDALNKPAGAR